MLERIVPALRRGFLPVALVGAIATVLFVSYRLSLTIGIRGLYAVLGLSIACLIYYGYPLSYRSIQASGDAVRWAEKGTYVLILGAVVAATQTSQRLFILLAVLPLGYLLLVYQLKRGVAVRAILPQTIGLFLISPLTKYLTLDFYYGSGDTLFHIHHIDRLLSEGTVAAITGQYIGHGSYQFFPGLHLLVGTFSSLTGLDAYDGLLTTGILVYGLFVILLMYVFSRTLFSWSEVAQYVAIGATLLYPLLYSSTYFFPQALAVPLLIFVIYIGFRATASQTNQPLNWTIVGLLATVSAVFTHHLSFIMLTPIILLLGLLPLILSVINSRQARGWSLFHPQIFPLIAGWMTAITYWTITTESFIINLVLAIRNLITEFFVAGSSAEAAQFVAFGTTVPKQTVQTAMLNLVSMNGLYLLSMTAVYALGITFFLKRYSTFRYSLSVVLLAILAAPLIFKTPFIFPGLSRTRMPFTFFFSLIFGLGLYRLVQSSSSVRVLHVVPVIVFVMLAATAPTFVWAGDDLYSIHDPPNGPPQQQVAFSHSEMAAFGEVNQFKRTYDTPLETSWIDTLAVERYGGTSVERARVTDGRLRAETGYLLYRHHWTEHSVVFDFQSPNILMSELWLQQQSASKNQVYDSGELGILWNRNSVVLEETA